MAALTGSASAAQTGTASLLGKTGTSNNLAVNKQVPIQQNAGMKNSVQTTSQTTMAATVPNPKTDKTGIIATMTNQIQSSQFLLQNQTLVPLVGTQMVLTQPQGLLLVGNNPTPGQKILLTQPQGFTQVTNTVHKNIAGQGMMTPLLANDTQPMVKRTDVTNSNTSSNQNATQEPDPKNKFLKFVSLPASTPSKVATVAPMRSEVTVVPKTEPNTDAAKHTVFDKTICEAGTTVKDGRFSGITEATVGYVEEEKTSTKSKEIEVKKENSDHHPKESHIANDLTDISANKNEESAVNPNVRKRPLFRTRKSLNTQGDMNIDACNTTVTKQEQFSDSDSDFRTEKQPRNETKVKKTSAEESNSSLHESKTERTESKSQKTEKKELQKLKSDMATNIGKSFNAAGMTTRRNKSRPSLVSAASKGGREEMTRDNNETDAKPAGPEVNKSVRGETKKSIADKLKLFRRESVDDGVLKEIKQEIQDNDSDFAEKIKSPVGSPDEQLNTRRRRSGRKRKSSPSNLKIKRSKGVDFVDEMDDPKENQVHVIASASLIKWYQTLYLCATLTGDKLSCLVQYFQ